MSSLNNAPKTEYRKDDFESKIQKLGLVLILSGLLSGLFCRAQCLDLGQTLDKLNAARAKITKKADKNPLAENANQPASLNRSSGDTSQVPSTVAESYLSAAEEAIRSKINLFKQATKVSLVFTILGGIYFTLASCVRVRISRKVVKNKL
jgi:hypothetical protein